MTLMDQLQMKPLSVSKETIIYNMPVNAATTQPFGYLHGGATAALAETVASLGALQHVKENEIVFGLELNINHLKAVNTGSVTATALPIHIGRTSHVWDVRVVDESDNLIAVSRCTMAVKAKRP